MKTPGQGPIYEIFFVITYPRRTEPYGKENGAM